MPGGGKQSSKRDLISSSSANSDNGGDDTLVDEAREAPQHLLSLSVRTNNNSGHPASIYPSEYGSIALCEN